MLGTKAIEMIKEQKRSGENIHSLKEDTLRQVFEETKILYEDNQKDVTQIVSNSVPLHSSIHMRHHIILHNRRCILAYLYNRLQQLRKLRWTFGSVLPPDIKDCMSDKEVAWFGDYNKVLVNYMSSVGVDLLQHTRPPKSLYIQVRCLVDYGDLLTDDGTTVTLTKNSTHLLKRSQCERLICLGILEHITQGDSAY